ncbi:alpha/beta fold hydrolase [Sphingomonas sp. 28-63-12]|uniref:alpha/beta fold hydrolase n=1 Tax=Sphingomonas sp. 28-63-12 TaxID=1970434 RepID=UPI000BD39097|nr:MAG: alpha/beta hydrolase [Sphingomonas sp. 28-63-12]
MLRTETAASPDRLRAALAGLAAYQAADRGAKRRLGGVRHRRGRARLRNYGGAGPPVIFIPSLINPPFILDLTRRQSLLRWLAQQGHRTLLLDWGTPDAAARDMDIADHVTQLLLPLIRRLAEPPILIGYCLGGTIAAAAACLTPVAGLAMIAAPWQFDGFDTGARARIAELWAAARPACKAMGFVPMEVLQTGFWQLDPARTISKYEAFAAMPPGGDAARTFVALEDWANAGAPLTFAAGAEMFESLFANNITGAGGWTIAGTAIDPGGLACPTIDFVSMHDRIVPAASAIGFADRRELAAGHVGMIVGSGARAQLWQPLADWISRTRAGREAPHHSARRSPP